MDVDVLAEKYRARAVAERQRLCDSVSSARASVARAAAILARDFGASEIWLFGSLAREPAHPNFDVDLAVAGVAPERWFEALDGVWATVQRPVDLLSLETCSEPMRARIRAEGVRLV